MPKRRIITIGCNADLTEAAASVGVPLIHLQPSRRSGCWVVPTAPAGTIAICHALQRNWRLTVLDISNNDLKGEGAKHIAAALPECK